MNSNGETVPTGSPNSGAPSVESVVRSAQIRQLYSQVRVGMLAAAAAAFAVVALLWHVAPRGRILLWAALFLAIQFPRHYLVTRFHRADPQGGEALPWGRLFLLGSASTALIFGMSAIVLFPSNSLIHQLLLACILAGFAASTAVAHAPLTECYVSSVLLILFPMWCGFLYERGEWGALLAAAGLAFAAALLGTGRSLHRMIAASVRLRFERDKTLEDLRQTHRMLEARVGERTSELSGKNDQLLKEVSERKRAEAELRMSEERFRTLVETMSLALGIQDENGLLTYVNDKHCELLGYSREELIGRRFGEFFDEESKRMVAEQFKQRRQGLPSSYEVTMVRKDGARLSAIISGTPIFDQDGRFKGSFGVATDITERRRAEEALRESEANYRSLIEFAPDGIFVQIGDHIEFANSAMAALMRAESPERLRGVRVLDLVHPDFQEAVEARIRRNLEEEEAIPLLTQKLIRLDGSEFYAEAVGAPISYKGVAARQVLVRDVTKRKRMEDAIKSIVEGVSGELGKEFFESSVTHFARMLQADFMLIGEIAQRSHGSVVRTLAFCADGALHDNFEYDLKGTPSEEAMKTGMCSCPRGVSGLFPQDRALEKSAVEAYVGIGLCDSHGRPMGVMAALYRAPLEDVEFAESVLRIFASRAAAEIERKRAEEALRNSEATLRTLLQAAPIGIGQVSADRILGWTNQLLCTMTGYSREELAGQGARILYESEDEFLRIGGVKRQDAVKYGAGQAETRFKRKDGTVFDVLIRSSPVHPGDLSGGLVFTAMDITERKRTEAQSRLNEARLKSLHDISQYKAETLQALLDFTLSEAVKLAESKVGYIYLYDEATRIFELNTWSKEVMKECEVAEPQTRYELDKTGIWGEAVRQRKPILVNDFRAPNAFKKGYPQGHVELRNFMTIPVFVGDRIVAVVGVGNKTSDYDEGDVRQLTLLMDSVWRIAEAGRAELAQRRAATALEHAVEGVLIADKDGVIQYVNPSLENMTGYSKDELLGANPRILKSGEQTAEFYTELWATITGGATWSGRFINKRKDGTLYTEEATISPVRDASGAITGFVGVKRDISERLALSKQLFHAQKMEAIGTLAGGIAHDFNNLLQVIMGCSDILLMTKEPGDPDRKKLDIIQQTARNGADLVSRILMFSRKQESRTCPINLNEVIRKAETLLRRTTPRMIEIKLVLAHNLRIIDADPMQVEQILLNLAVNAHHAMPDGGVLLIETGNVALTDEYLRTHLEAKAGHYVLLNVSDTGVGIEPDVIDRIFEPFFTTKKNGEGTGLGLSMVHGIVSQHGGYIRCYSEPGRGASFKIYFPVSARELTPELNLTREMPAFGTETILLVDDDDRVREMGRQMIEMGGYRLLTASSGEEALEIYVARKKDIAAVILDLIMPGMGGRRCIEGLLRLDPTVRILVTSGYSSDALTPGPTGGGTRGFIRKPYDSKDILRAIRTVLDKGRL